MANNHTQFSFQLKLDKDQVNYLRNIASRLDLISIGDLEPTNEWEKQLVEKGSTGFVVLLNPEGAIIHSDESGDPEIVAEVLLNLSNKFSLPPIGFEWADICSHHRPGEFGGGAAIIDSSITYFSTSKWLQAALSGTKIAS